MTEGTVSAWRIAEGALVEKGDIIADISIEKLSNELTAPVGGTVIKLLAEEGDELPCGAAIAVIGREGEPYEHLLDALELPSVSAGSMSRSAQAPKPQPEEQPQGLDSCPESAGSGVTPKAAKLAQELGVDLRGIRGTGRHQLITREDVRAAARAQEQQVPAAPPEHAVSAPVPSGGVIGGQAGIVKMTPMQSAICRSMSQSWASCVPSTVTRDLVADELVAQVAGCKPKFAEVGVKLSYTVYLIKALALALAAHPDFRSSVQDEQHLYVTEQIHIGVAMDVPNGLVVPKIRNANEKSILTIADELGTLVRRAREGRLCGDDLEGGTMTLTNLGNYQIKYFTPVINPPESAILGVGSLFTSTVSQGNSIRFVNIMPLSLTVDHRVISGAPASRFLDTFCDLLSHPAQL